MEIFKIEKGNSFVLHIKMQKVYIGHDIREAKTFDMSNVSGLEVSFATKFSKEIPLDVNSQVTTYKDEIQIAFPSNIEEDIYGITVRGRYNGKDFRCKKTDLFRIVPNGERSYIPLSEVISEIGDMFRTSYWIELNVPDVQLEFVAEPSVIVYDGEDHQVQLSWSVMEDGCEITPDSIVVTHNDLPMSFSPEQKQTSVTLNEIGKYQYQLEVAISSRTYTAEAEVEIRKIAWYGASSVTDAKLLDLSTLNHDLSTLVDKYIDVTTTDDEDIVWFVSEVQLQFIQANLIVELEETVIDGVYYYKTVPLLAGENEFEIKSK